MKRFLLPVTLIALAGCAESTAPPSSLYHGYSLTTVDGKALPVPLSEGGTLLVANTLVFEQPVRTQAGTTLDGLVRYTLVVKRPGEPLEDSEIELNYQVRGDELRIDLCPPLALCIAETVLVGTITGRTDPLVLRHYFAVQAGSEYRFFPVLPE